MIITALLADGLFNYYKVTPGGSEEIYSFGTGIWIDYMFFRA